MKLNSYNLTFNFFAKFTKEHWVFKKIRRIYVFLFNSCWAAPRKWGVDHRSNCFSVECCCICFWLLKIKKTYIMKLNSYNLTFNFLPNLQKTLGFQKDLKNLCFLFNSCWAAPWKLGVVTSVELFFGRMLVHLLLVT